MTLLLLVWQATSTPGIGTTVISVVGAIIAGVIVNHFTTKSTMASVLAELKGSSVERFKAIDEDLDRHETTNGKQWEKINEIDRQVSVNKVTCDSKHFNVKGHHA